MAFTTTVILAGTSGESRFFPITEGMPKALLPIGNRPVRGPQLSPIQPSGRIPTVSSQMLVYLLQTLLRCGCERAVVATTSRYEDGVRAALLAEAAEGWLVLEGAGGLEGVAGVVNASDRVSVSIAVVDELVGSVGALREALKVSPSVREVLVLSGECQLGSSSLLRLVEAHRLRRVDCACLARRLAAKEKIEAEDAELWLLDTNGFVADKVSRLELDEDDDGDNGTLRVPCALVETWPNVRAAADLVDCHAYVFAARALLEALDESEPAAAVKAELVPVMARNFARSRTNPGPALVDYAALMAADDSQSGRGVVAVMPDESADDDPADPLGSSHCSRIRSVHEYAALCRHVVARAIRGAAFTPRGHPSKRDGTLVGDQTTIGDKVQLKHSTVGARCIVGPRCKINNSVIFDDARIEDGCVVQNSIVAARAIIGARSNLNDVQVGPGASVPPGSTLKQEAVTADSNYDQPGDPQIDAVDDAA